MKPPPSVGILAQLSPLFEEFSDILVDPATGDAIDVKSRAFRASSDFVLPEPKNAPARLGTLRIHPLISVAVPLDLQAPILLV